MEAKNNKARASVKVLVLKSVLVLLFLAFTNSRDYHRGIFGSVTSAQPVVNIQPIQTLAAIYVKFDGIDGESRAPEHNGWIDVLSFSQGQYIKESSSGASVDGVSSVFEEIILRKELDKASPRLAEAVCLGKIFPNVYIHVTRGLSDGTKITYYTYELKNAMITRYRIGGSAENEIPREQISVKFEQIKVVYNEYNLDGRPESLAEYSWDVVQNQRP